MKAQVFKIPGKVQAKQRPRFSKGRVYTPQETANYEVLVKWCYKEQAYRNGWNMLNGSIRCEIDIFMPIPKSSSKVKKMLMESFKIRPKVKPDIDNCIKSILDGLNGVAYQDDKQVVEVEVKKFYSQVPEVNVRLIKIEEEN